MQRQMSALCLGLCLGTSAIATDANNAAAVSQPYFRLGLSGVKSFTRNAEPSFHNNVQTSGIEAILPVTEAFGAKLGGSYGLSDSSSKIACGQFAVRQAWAEGFWRNPQQGKVGAYAGRELGGCSGEQSDSYNRYGLIGEYYFNQGWIGASANYLRADHTQSGGVDYDSYVATLELQPKNLTITAHLSRNFQTPVQQDLSRLFPPRDTLSFNSGDIKLTAYASENLALSAGMGQPLHFSNDQPKHGASQLMARWQPDALGRNLEFGASVDITHDWHIYGLQLTYYFDSKTSLIDRDRNLRY